MRNVEIEFKYDASKVKLKDFIDFCSNKRLLNKIVIFGCDDFYENKTQPCTFYRHRTNDFENQLTFKRKHDKDNNTIRTEYNIILDKNANTKDDIKGFLLESGYKFNTTLFKTCFIYQYEFYILVYYICYDESMAEVGRFIEIEAKEDYDWSSNKEAVDSIAIVEKMCKSLGLSPDKRLKKSLYEMYRKGN